MITLLDNLDLLQSKTDKAVFRERSCLSLFELSVFELIYWLCLLGVDVLPLVYNALESDHAVVSFTTGAGVGIYDKFVVGTRACIESCAKPLRDNRLRRGAGSHLPACEIGRAHV